MEKGLSRNEAISIGALVCVALAGGFFAVEVRVFRRAPLPAPVVPSCDAFVVDPDGMLRATRRVDIGAQVGIEMMPGARMGSNVIDGVDYAALWRAKCGKPR